MLMDEPFGAIDPIDRERLQNEFLRLQAEIRKTVLFVTHDIDEAIKMGDRIAVMQEGGRLAQYATPAELLMAPADDFVEDFVGADRALKRLALMRVRDVDLWEAPLAYVGQATAEVKAKLDGAEVPHALLVDSDRRPLGWLSEPDLEQETVPETPDTSPDPVLDGGHAPRRALGPAPGRVAATRRSSTATADRRRALGRDHLRLPDSPEAKVRGARRRRAAARAMPGPPLRSWRRSRSSATAPATSCVAENETFCFDWAADNFDRYVTRRSSTWCLSWSRSCSAFDRVRPGAALPPAALAHPAVHGGDRDPLHDPVARLLLPAAPVTGRGKSRRSSR